MRPLVGLIGLALLTTGAAAIYDSSGPVVSLTAGNFEGKIKSGGVWLVEVRRPAGEGRVVAWACN